MAEDLPESKIVHTDERFKLNVSKDNMQVLLSCQLADISGDGAYEEICKLLKKMGVKKMPEPGVLKRGLDEAVAGGVDIVNLPVAEGQTPVMPTDAKLEWTGDYFTEGYYIDPKTKRIDFRQKISNPAVEKDQLLAIIYKAIPGKNGVDVFGRTITVPRAHDVRLRAGNNVYWSKEDSGYKARVAGRVKLIGVTLDVDEVLYVRNGVGTESGNIKHKGQVIVDGDIESEYKVEATGNIEVKGVIQSDIVSCGGNLVVVEGINENPAKLLNVRGDIISKYILNASIECEGNIVANREIFQSQIKSRGEVTCTEGRVVGGEIMAARGITVGEAGSKGAVKTAFVAGVDYTQLAMLKACNKKIDQLKKVIKKLRPAHRMLSMQMQALTSAQKEGLAEIGSNISEAEENIKELEAEGMRIRKEMISNRSARIIILRMVYPGVVLRVHDSRYTVEHALRGPMMAHLDSATGEIALTSEVDRITS
ncbi:MAG: DUF342 domain-containing protein [Candidatus Zixiibacteriota bacterium]|nr:MAG: DUF342 domain-containing protein [candidate division Zixibacteria bacterium]